MPVPQAKRINSAVNSGQQACHGPNAAFTCPNRSKRLRLQPTTIHHHQQPSLHAETSISWPHMPTQVSDCNDMQAAPFQHLSGPVARKQPIAAAAESGAGSSCWACRWHKPHP